MWARSAVAVRWRRFVAPTVSAFVLAAVVVAAQGAVPDDVRRQVTAFLAAGEFAPAFALAERQPLGPDRDRLFAEIASAQSAAGYRGGSLSTAALIQDDRTRAATVRETAGRPLGAQGGGVQPDFETLIELLTSTIAPTTWTDVGGQGAVKPFRGGIYVDSQGAMHRILQEDKSPAVAALWSAGLNVGENRDARAASRLRKVSLNRLEREVQLALAAGRPLPEDMQTLAGLQRIEYVLVYPETGDLVLAGPAGNWQTDLEGRVVSADNGRAVVRLEDLVVLLRHFQQPGNREFGCSITPTEESLARVQAFVQQSSAKPIKAAERPRWLEQLRAQLGAQVVEVDGIDPRTRVAQVLVEADYRMKLVGIGLEPGTHNCPSYLDMLASKGTNAPIGVLRWWFTMNYQALAASADHRVFGLRGQGVQVLSENEMLTARGQRVHTGNSDDLNAEFARNFTRDFTNLAVKYPVYGDLQNIFDLALVATLLRAEDLPGQVGWHMTCFADPREFPVARGMAPTSTQTVINHRVVNKTQILAVVSGGVTADPLAYVQAAALDVDRQGKLESERARATPGEVPPRGWWWD